MRIEVKDSSENMLAQALRRNYLQTTDCLLKKIGDEFDVANALHNIGKLNKQLLNKVVNRLSLEMKLQLLKIGGFIHGMDMTIAPILNDPQVQNEIKKEFGAEKAKLILNPIFIRALIYHLSLEVSIFIGRTITFEIWEMLDDPEFAFLQIVKENYISIDNGFLNPIDFRRYYHSDDGYAEMTRLRYEGRKLFPDAYGDLCQDLDKLLAHSMSKNDFELYAAVLENLITTKIDYAVPGYQSPCFLDPKYLTKCVISVGSSSTLISALEEYQKLPADHPVKTLITDWFSHEITNEQLAYAKKLKEDSCKSLFDNIELNRLILCIVDRLILQQKYEYNTIHKVSKKVRENIKPLFPESLTHLIAFLAKDIKIKAPEADEKKIEGVGETTAAPILKRTDTISECCLGDDVAADGDALIEMDEKEQKFERKAEVADEGISDPSDYLNVAIQFILKDIGQYIENTKGFFSSLFSSLFNRTYQFLQPIEKILSVLTKKSENMQLTLESKLYVLKLCLALLVCRQAQDTPDINKLVNILYQKLVGEPLATIFKTGDKIDDVLQTALRQDVISKIKSILDHNKISCEDLSIINIVNEIEVSLNKKPAEEKATSDAESQVSLTV